MLLTAGGQVLLLSPSASGVPRAAHYLSALKQASKGKMYHYHPDVSEAKRIELYKYLSSTEEACLILGNRSAIFLPCRRLQLIIIDDEQEYMYKHQYTAPLFHARDIALYLQLRSAYRYCFLVVVLLQNAFQCLERKVWFNRFR